MKHPKNKNNIRKLIIMLSGLMLTAPAFSGPSSALSQLAAIAGVEVELEKDLLEDTDFQKIQSDFTGSKPASADDISAWFSELKKGEQPKAGKVFTGKYNDLKRTVHLYPFWMIDKESKETPCILAGFMIGKDMLLLAIVERDMEDDLSKIKPALQTEIMNKLRGNQSYEINKKNFKGRVPCGERGYDPEYALYFRKTKSGGSVMVPVIGRQNIASDSKEDPLLHFYYYDEVIDNVLMVVEEKPDSENVANTNNKLPISLGEQRRKILEDKGEQKQEIEKL